MQYKNKTRYLTTAATAAEAPSVAIFFHHLLITFLHKNPKNQDAGKFQRAEYKVDNPCMQRFDLIR